jgi:hypothetical protein
MTLQDNMCKWMPRNIRVKDTYILKCPDIVHHSSPTSDSLRGAVYWFKVPNLRCSLIGKHVAARGPLCRNKKCPHRQLVFLQVDNIGNLAGQEAAF